MTHGTTYQVQRYHFILLLAAGRVFQPVRIMTEQRSFRVQRHPLRTRACCAAENCDVFARMCRLPRLSAFMYCLSGKYVIYVQGVIICVCCVFLKPDDDIPRQEEWGVASPHALVPSTLCMTSMYGDVSVTTK